MPRDRRFRCLASTAVLSALMLVVAACGARWDPGSSPAPSPSRPAASGPDGVPVPVIWSWQMPLGHARGHPHIIQFVRRFASRRPPEHTADKVCDDILQRRLKPGQVAILLQNYGLGDGDPKLKEHDSIALFRHHKDSLPSGSVNQWWMTIWMSHGIAECRAWMDRFIARYRARQQADPRIPDPSRFHFDSERPVVPHYSRRGVVEAFDAMRRDPRFSSEPLPGHGGRTLGQLYRDAGEPACDPTQSWGHPRNRAWSVWYGGVCMQALDGAMNESAYVPIRQAWPGCKSSNYRTSASYDGQGSPPRLFHGNNPQHEWFRLSWRGSGDLQAPVLSGWATPSLVRQGESRAQATFRRHEQQIEFNVASAGGDGARVTPWLRMNGWVNRKHTTPTPIPAALTEASLAMMRDKGIREVLLWSDESTQQSHVHWNELVEIVNRVWGAPAGQAPR